MQVSGLISLRSGSTLLLEMLQCGGFEPEIRHTTSFRGGPDSSRGLLSAETAGFLPEHSGPCGYAYSARMPSEAVDNPMGNKHRFEVQSK